MPAKRPRGNGQATKEGVPITTRGKDESGIGVGDIDRQARWRHAGGG